MRALCCVRAFLELGRGHRRTGGQLVESLVEGEILLKVFGRIAVRVEEFDRAKMCHVFLFDVLGLLVVAGSSQHEPGAAISQTGSDDQTRDKPTVLFPHRYKSFDAKLVCHGSPPVWRFLLFTPLTRFVKLGKLNFIRELSEKADGNSHKSCNNSDYPESHSYLGGWPSHTFKVMVNGSCEKHLFSLS